MCGGYHRGGMRKVRVERLPCGFVAVLLDSVECGRLRFPCLHVLV